MLALFVTILVKHSHSLSLAPFNPGNSLQRLLGDRLRDALGRADVRRLRVGRDARRGDPGRPAGDPDRAVLRGRHHRLFYVLSSYAASIGFGSGAGSHEFATDTAPFTTLADSNWGSSVAWIVSLTVINSQFANSSRAPTPRYG